MKGNTLESKTARPLKQASAENETKQGFTLPFLGLLGDDGFGQHVLVELRLQIARVRVLEKHRTLQIDWKSLN